MPHVSKGDIHAYLDGALGAFPEDEAERVRQHLDECDVCARLLDEERQLRLVASEILAATAEAPLDLAPFEELVARAGESEPGRPAAGGSSFRTLRMAATIVVSLGAGWLARDLTSPARDLATTPSLAAGAVQGGLESRANEAVNAFDADSGDRQAELDDFSASAAAPVQSQDLDAETAPTAARGAISAISEVSAPSVDAPTADAPDVARMESAEEAEVGRRDVGGAASQLVQQRVSEALPQAAAAIVTDEVSVAGRTGSFVIPGLPIRDVYVSSVFGDTGPAVTIVHGLPDGRTIELRFVPGEGGDDSRKVALREAQGPERSERDALKDAEGLMDLPLPEGWSQVVRAVPGGLGILRGSLGEAQLSDLLDRAVAGR